MFFSLLILFQYELIFNTSWILSQILVGFRFHQAALITINTLTVGGETKLLQPPENVIFNFL